ncbi:FAD/NAD(P)-binding protein [Dinoroseobacter sp. S76]|uniref:FAD/NAD(P)-binding protein n=1 Tax=Dinoroseobacter sp. S76 TaxID=3415124 RepID=UPI003C7D6FBD
MLPQERPHVIVGDGITALAFLEICAPEPGQRVIVLGQRAAELGRGLAYAKGEVGTPWRYAYLLNSPADDIDPDFAKWLAARWDQITETMAGRAPDWLGAAQPLIATGDLYGVNAPREFYGDFMEERTEAAIARLKARGVEVDLLEDQAVSLEVSGKGITLRTEAGREIVASGLDVAPGGPSTMRFAGDDSAFSAPSVFGHEARIATHIQRGAEIFCIGGNAAMLDVLRLCQSLRDAEDLRFVACAPDGEIPEPLVPRLPRKLTEPRLTQGHMTAATFLAEVAAEIARAKAEGDEMREIRAGFRAHFLENPLSGYVTDPEEARQVPGKLRLWLRGGTRDTIADMHQFVEAGRARVIQAMVTAIEPGEAGATVILRDPEGQEQRHETGFVVNCAGAGPNSRFDPLSEDMLRQGMITLCPTTKGIRVGPGCQTAAPGVRYLSPVTSEIGGDVVAMPLFDAHMLRAYVARAGATA